MRSLQQAFLSASAVTYNGTKRLDGKLAQALMSIQAIKGVEIGMGFEMSKKSGSEVMDEIFYKIQNSKFKISNFIGRQITQAGLKAG